MTLMSQTLAAFQSYFTVPGIQMLNRVSIFLSGFFYGMLHSVSDLLLKHFMNTVPNISRRDLGKNVCQFSMHQIEDVDFEKCSQL